ncbi:MAG: transposase [Vicinamibacterales bacterium]
MCRSSPLVPCTELGRIKRTAVPPPRQCASPGIIAEVGATAATFPSPKHLASWMGACPGNEESAGVNCSHRCPKGNRQMRRAQPSRQCRGEREGDELLRRPIADPPHHSVRSALPRLQDGLDRTLTLGSRHPKVRY